MDEHGILIDALTSNFVVTDNRINNCDIHGIQVGGSSHTIANNQINNVGFDGIRYDDESSSNAVIADNQIGSNGRDGIAMEGNQATIVGNTCRSNGRDGIASSGSVGAAVDNAVVGNVCTSNTRYGIKLGNGTDGDSATNVVVGNVVTNNTSTNLRYGHTSGAKESIIQHNVGDTGSGSGPGTSPSRSVEFSDQRTTLTTGGGSQKWVAPIDLTIIDVQLAVGTSPTGADLIVDVHKNTVTIFTTQGNRPTVPDGDADGIGAAATPDVTAMTAGQYLTIDIDQIGSTIAGGELTVVIEWRPT